jgi:hypothetical protein
VPAVPEDIVDEVIVRGTAPTVMEADADAVCIGLPESFAVTAKL